MIPSACLAAIVLVGACDRAPTHNTRSDHDRLAPSAQPPENAPNSDVGPKDPPLVRAKVSQFHMGMMVHLTVWANSTEQGQSSCAAAFRRVREINLIMSDYEPTSELSRLCRKAGQGPVPVSEELFEVLTAARRLAQLTAGRFDPTLAPVVRLWREARQSDRLPDPSALQQARQLVGYEGILLDRDKRTVELARTGMLLDLGSIAKGYAGDQALKVLQQEGIRCAAFEAGGDKVFGDPPPGTKGWPVDPGHPRVQPLELANCAVGISGDTVQYVEKDGKRYSHVIDPQTGQGITARRTCLVVAPNGMTADPLATIGTLMPAEQFEVLMKRHFSDARFWVLPAVPDGQEDNPRIPPPSTRRDR